MMLFYHLSCHLKIGSPLSKVMNKKEAIKKMLEGEDVTNIKTLESYHLLLYCNKERVFLKDFKEGDYI